MGNFYVNYATRGPDRDAVAKSLRSAERKAFVGPTVDGTTMFFEEESDGQDDARIKELGTRVSQDLAAPILAVLNHDDDVLAYWLFEAGELVDEYNSWPGCFGEGDDTPSGGDASRLCAAFGVAAKAEQVEKVLRGKGYAFAVFRHQALAKLLKIPESYVSLGYDSIKRWGLPAAGGAALDLLEVE